MRRECSLEISLEKELTRNPRGKVMSDKTKCPECKGDQFKEVDSPWIDVKDQLPETSETVIVWEVIKLDPDKTYARQSTGYYTKTNNTWRFRTGKQSNSYGVIITHWCPISKLCGPIRFPDPPKEQKR